MKVIGLIPARLDSTRLPGKALIEIRGIPAIVHTYKRCCMAKRLDEVYVATNSPDIRAAVEQHGGKVIMTGEQPNGTERIHEASQSLDGDIYVLVNGDEILVYPDHIDRIAGPLISDPSIEYIVGMAPYDKIGQPQVLKGVANISGDLMYFSRADIHGLDQDGKIKRQKMVFIVGFTKASLDQYVAWPRTPLEIAENTEFIRILEHGHKIKTVEVEGAKTMV